jgi:hypothetical protein
MSSAIAAATEHRNLPLSILRESKPIRAESSMKWACRNWPRAFALTARHPLALAGSAIE